MRRHLVWIVGLAISLAAASIALGTSAQDLSGRFASDKAQKAKRIRGKLMLVDGRTPASVRRYWSPRRMRSARPALLRAPVGGRVPAEGRAEGPIDIPFIRYEVTETTNYPARAHGKAFFSQGGSDWSCSGTVVTSQTQSLVLTAGHCVADTKGAGTGWASNWMFAPGYHSGLTPFGEFPARWLTAPKAWTQQHKFSFDMGAAVVSTTSTGHPVQALVGSRGISWNQPATNRVQAWGYPGDPFNGRELYVCESTSEDDPFYNWTPERVLAIGCDLHHGSSGGGWIIGGGVVNSVNSFHRDDHPNVEFGPYFGQAAALLYGYACCSLAPPASTPPQPVPQSPTPPADLTPPDTRLVRTPSAVVVAGTRATFAFTATEPDSTFECRVDAGSWFSCRSPRRLARPVGRHVFWVRARDWATNLDPTAARWAWRIVVGNHRPLERQPSRSTSFAFR